jgi:PhnB protein
MRWQAAAVIQNATRTGGPMALQPYLFFDGRAEEAAEYYRSRLGAEVVAMMRMKESPEPQPAGMLPPGSENKVMHMTLKIGNATLMGSDGMCNSQGPTFKGFAIALDVASDADADRLFAALADGGQVQMPIGKTFFARRFGMVADRFGVPWMVSTGT